MEEKIKVLEQLVEKRATRGISGLNQQDIDTLVNTYGEVIHRECELIWEKIVRGECKTIDSVLSWHGDININMLMTSRSVVRPIQWDLYDVLIQAQILITDIINDCDEDMYPRISIDCNLFREDGKLSYKYNLQSVAGDAVNIYSAYGDYDTKTKMAEMVVVTHQDNVDISELIKKK